MLYNLLALIPLFLYLLIIKTPDGFEPTVLGMFIVTVLVFVIRSALTKAFKPKKTELSDEELAFLIKHPELLKKAGISAQPTIATEKLMISQLPALYLSDKNPFYYETYLNRLASLGIPHEDAEKLFIFECGIVQKHNKAYLTDPNFTRNWFLGLKQPFYLSYPKSKDDILKKNFLPSAKYARSSTKRSGIFGTATKRSFRRMFGRKSVNEGSMIRAVCLPLNISI